MTKDQIEQALDQGKLYTLLMHNGHWWRLRRNGKTKTWKRTPEKFSIPVKAGLRNYGYVDQTSLTNFTDFYQIRDC